MRKQYYAIHRRKIMAEVNARYHKHSAKILKSQRKYYKKNRKAILQRMSEYQKQYPRSYEQHVKLKYGISPSTYKEMFKKQAGKCAICKRKQPKNARHFKRLCIDHCHSTGKVRGLLCTKCNHGIGEFRDNPKLCIKAATYLRKHT